MRMPFPTPPTRHFGMRWLVLPGQTGFWNNHTGCDWSKWSGTAIPAADSGQVIGNYYTSLKGYQLVVRNRKTGRITRYHMLEQRSHKTEWSDVSEGEIIGYVGSSGTASTGPHLHFELWIDGKPVDPYKYITAQLASDGATPIENEEMPLTNDEIEKIARRSAELVWARTVTRTGGKVSAIQELADAKSAGLNAPAAVWNEVVHRNDGDVSVKQELADTKNATKRLESAVEELGKAIAAIKIPEPAPAPAPEPEPEPTPTPEPEPVPVVIDIEQLSRAIVDKLPENTAATKQDVIDALGTLVLKNSNS